MSAGADITPHDVSPEAALDAISVHRGPLLLDLDETLYLRNSTEDFIDSAYPRLPALLLLRLLDAFRPWRWTGGEVTRDVWRVRLILALFPWVAAHWRRRVGALAADFGNRRLIAALSASEATTIVTTVGFGPIVAPLVAAFGMPSARIVASRVSFADRRAGKYRLALDALGESTVCSSLVITDSSQDLHLLDACARPLRTVWPEACRRNALGDVYLPGQYLTQVKRPGAKYILRGILQEDFAFWILASIALAAEPGWHLAGLTLLLVSFWAIYERGYVDNDLVAARYESDPFLSAEFHQAPVATPRWRPWIWAAGCGAAAIVLLRWPNEPTVVDFAAWTAVLLATHLWFLIYNRFDKSTRLWLFAGLQFARSAAFVVLVPILPIGAAALGAHVLARWVPYHLYRVAGKAWPQIPVYLIRLLFFVVLAALLAVASGPAMLWSPTALALLAWNLYRARREITAVCKAARRIDPRGKQAPERPPAES